MVPLLASSMPGAGRPFALSSVAFVLLFVVLLTLRVKLALQQKALDNLYVAQED